MHSPTQTMDSHSAYSNACQCDPPSNTPGWPTAPKEKASRTRAEELFAELEASHRQLKEYAGQVAELATTRERNRLARDIHDTPGHFLTVINVQLEKALAYRETKPQEAGEAISSVKRLADE
jgi:signal transduction histidine kinase